MKFLKLILICFFALCTTASLFGCSIHKFLTDETTTFFNQTEAIQFATEGTETVPTSPTVISSEPQTVVADNKAAFVAVLEGVGTFIYEGNTITLTEYCSTFRVPVMLDAVAIADLEWDGIPEVVLDIKIDLEYSYGVLVLHIEGDNIWGYTFSERQLGDIKKDGTFHQSGGASNNGVAILSLSMGTVEYKNQLWVEENEDGVLRFFVAGAEVTSEEYDAVLAEWLEKEETIWRPYPMDSYKELF